jgi:hypothetical protein
MLVVEAEQEWVLLIIARRASHAGLLSYACLVGAAVGFGVQCCAARSGDGSRSGGVVRVRGRVFAAAGWRLFLVGGVDGGLDGWVEALKRGVVYDVA